MLKKRHAMMLMVTVGQLCWLSFALADDADWVRVTPKETNKILANPGMGWETFHRTADNDKNLPAWIPSTIHYARWGWGTLEPQKGKIDYDFLDGVLKETHEAGQQLAFRVMCCSSYKGRPYHPDWLEDIGGKVVMTRYGDGPDLEVPVLDDSNVIAAHLDFIKRLGDRYDGHPDIAHVDLGSVGWWGEWHMSKSTNASMPTLANQKRIVDAYLEAFKETPLVMLIGGGEMLKYAVNNGTGWRADCLGDMGGFSKPWCHMRMAYRLTDGGGDDQVFVGNVTVNKWLPGEIELFTEEFFEEPADLPPGDVVDVAESISLPNDMSPGTYTLSIGVVGEEATKPMVQLGIEGRSNDGWYALSKVTVTR